MLQVCIIFLFGKQTCSQNNPEFWMIFASSAAENLITILQARDCPSVQSQSSPVRAPEGCSYNSHGSSIQESPSERESQIYTVILNVNVCPLVNFASHILLDLYWCGWATLQVGTFTLVFPPCWYSGLSEHAQCELHLSCIRQRADGAGQRVVELCCRAEKRRHQRDTVKG